MNSQDKKRKPLAKSVTISTGEPTPSASGPSPRSGITQAQGERCLAVAAYMEQGVASVDLPDGFAALALRIRNAVAARESAAYFAALVAEAATKFAVFAEEHAGRHPQIVTDNARALKDLADTAWEIAMDAEDPELTVVVRVASPKASDDTDEEILQRLATALCEVDCETVDGWRRKPVTEAIVSVTHALTSLRQGDVPVASMRVACSDVAASVARVLHRQLENISVDAATRVEIIDRTAPIFELCAEILRRSRAALAGQVAR